MIKLIIQGKCISKDNEKIFNKQGRTFLSAKFKRYALIVALQARLQYYENPLEDDLSVNAIFTMSNRVHADLTNLPKGLFDALNGIVWKDDRQIKVCNLSICYRPKENPRVDLYINRIE